MNECCPGKRRNVRFLKHFLAGRHGRRLACNIILRGRRMRWADISIKKRLYGAFGLATLLFVLTIIFTLFDLDSINRDAEEIAKPRQDTVLLAAEVAHLQ